MRYSNGINPFAFAVSIIKYSIALALAPFAVFENIQFFRLC